MVYMPVDQIPLHTVDTNSINDLMTIIHTIQHQNSNDEDDGGNDDDDDDYTPPASKRSRSGDSIPIII
jgi:hypothetical protein